MPTADLRWLDLTLVSWDGEPDEHGFAESQAAGKCTDTEAVVVQLAQVICSQSSLLAS